MDKEISKILVESLVLKVKNKTFANKMKKKPTTVSLCCNNENKPSLETLVGIAKILNIDDRMLMNPTI